MTIIRLIFALVVFLSFSGKSQVLLQQTEVDTLTIASGLDIPWEIIYGPDDHLWITERYGIVSRINLETGEINSVLDLPYVVYQSGESGLLGMVLHPDFENEPLVFLAYTYYDDGDIKEKIVRYEFNGTLLENEEILLDNITGNTTHIGCRLIITPDDKLLITTGDAQNQPTAQDLDHLSGKILRLNLDGSIPDDNPWPDNPVYSYGHRNAQGLFLASNGILYSSEHGPNTDDELNVIEAGQNYGWPEVHGFCDLPDEIIFCNENDVYEPLQAWTPTVAASDFIYYDHPSIPEWQGNILMTSLKNKRLYALQLDENGTGISNEEQYFQNLWGRLRDICLGPDGSVYLATNGPDWSNSQPYSHMIIKVWNPEYSTSIEDPITTRDNFVVFPNPAARVVRLEVDQGYLGGQLTIQDHLGRSLDSLILDSVLPEISVSHLPSGLYLLKIEQPGKNTLVRKLVINRWD